MVRNTRLAKCLVISCVANGLLVCAVGSSRLLHPAANVTELLRPVPVSSYKPRPLASKPVVKRQPVEVQPTPAPQADSSRQKTSAKQEAASSPAAKLTTGAKAFAGAKASAKKLASAPQKTGAAKMAGAKTGGRAKGQGSTRMAKAAGGVGNARAAKAGGAHERAVAAKRSEAAAALRAAKAQLVSARNAQRQAERKVAVAKRALFEAQRKRESLSSARVAATQARQTLAQTQRDFHSALLSTRRTPEDMQKLAMEASFKTIAANSNADLKAKQAQSKEAQDAANQAMKEATQALEEASRQATASSAAQQELIAKLNNLSRVSKGKAPAVSTGSMASGGQEIKAEADEKPGEQEPEKQTKKHKPVTRIVLKTIKMWAPKPGQKLSLPTNLEIVLSNDLKVIPGPPLDEDQLAELAQMMAHRNLQQVKMNRRQLKALLETRRQSESRKPKPKPKESENADASEQGRHREGKKPEREKKASTGEKKPKDPNANLKKPNTPFQVRQWDTDMSQRWAKRVRDESEMGTNDGAQTPKPNQQPNQPTPSNSNDATQPNGNQGAAPENTTQGTPAAGGIQNPLTAQTPQNGNAQGGNTGNENNGAAGAGGATAGGGNNPQTSTGGAGQNGAQGATAEGTQGNGQGNGQGGEGKGATGAGGNNAGGNNQGVAGAGGNGQGGNGAGANGTGGNGQGVTGQGANGNAQGAGGGQGGSGNGQGVGGGSGSGNGQGVGGGSGSGNGQGVGGGSGSGNGQGVGGGSGSGNGQGVGGGSGSGGGQGVGGGSGSGSGQGVGGGSGSGSGSGSGNGQGVGSGSGSGSGSGGGNGQGVGSGGSGPGSDGNGGGGNGIGEGDGGEGEAGAEYSSDGGGSAGALSGEGGDGGGWDTDIETRDDGQGVDSKKGDQNKTEVDLPPDAPVGGHTIPGGLVLPPVPPVGTENGKAKTLRQVSPSTVQVPTQERKAVSGRSAVPPVRGGATDQIRRAIPPQKNNPTRLAMRPGARMVAQNTAEPQKMQPAPQGDPQRAVKKAVPRALTIGSTSSRGTVAFTVMPRPTLPLGSVTDVIDPNLPPANGVAKSKTVAMKHQATPAMKQPVLAPAGMPTRPVFKVVPPVPPVQPKARPGILAQKPVAAIKAHSGQIKLAHNSEGVKEGSEQPLPAAPLPGNMDQIGDGSGLKGDYYLGNAFNEFIFSRADANINFTFSSVLPDHSPNPRIPAFADYTARWTGRIAATHSETYTFYAAVDDGIRVWIDHKLILDQWGPHSPIQFSSQFTFEAGRQYLFKCEYMATDGGTSLIHLYWESPSTPKQFVPQDSFFYPLATDEVELEKDKGPQIIR